MGIKIDEAYYEETNKDIDTQEAAKIDPLKLRGKLKCKICGTKLSFVKGYKKEVNDAEVFVKPYFRLMNKENDHMSGCKYNTVGLLRIMAKGSSDNILEEIENYKFNFRLHLVSSAIRGVEKELGGKEKGDKIDNTVKAPEKKFSEKSEKLDSYLSNMRSLIKLRSVLEENSDISPKVTLQFRDNEGIHRITWNHFYYDIDRLYECYEYISSKKPKHPICIAGTIKNVQDPKPNYDYYTIKLYAPKATEVNINGAKVYKIPAVEVTLMNRDLIELIKGQEGKEILLYGNFWTTAPIKAKTSNSYFLNIKTKILHKNQFLIEK